VVQKYKFLEWDTQHFGYKIASVHPDAIMLAELKLLTDELKSNDFRLAYFFVNPLDEISNDVLQSVSAFMADEKVTFGIHLDQDSIYEISPSIMPYKLGYTSEKIKNLALQSGIYSRFKLDKNFVADEYVKLYTEWIDKSVKKIIADEALIYYKNEEEMGLVTLAINKSKGSIGLVAVDELERGNSIGKHLMNAALFYFKEKGITNIEVVTQKANKIACEFYRALGFEIRNVENIYHLWIK
jgi:dTDP-4-amino-4,6-dideoxy-D-galactose acyltransferase